MRTLRTPLALILLIVLFGGSEPPVSAPTQVSFTSSGATAKSAAVIPVAHAETTDENAPKTLSIPSIHLTAPVLPMGVRSNGELDVPNGSTNAVGWYEAGTTPGDTGSAVMDAHVYAALKNLRYAKVGRSVYVTTKGGKKIRFVIKESLLYPYDKVPPYYLFLRSDAARLNIITCAGVYDPRIGTYTKRLVVYAVRAD